MKQIGIILLIGLAGLTKAQNLTTGLQACYPLDCDGAANYATTGASLNGSIFSVTCTAGHTGAPSSAYQFAGISASHIKLPASSLIKPQAISVSGWYSVTNVSNNPYLVFTKNSCFGPQEAYVLGVSNSKFVVEKTDASCTRDLLYSASAITPGFHHVVFYIDNSIMELYVDGNYTSMPTSLVWDYVPTKQVILGGSQESFDSPFMGVMDNLRFYDRRLTPAEVTLLFENDPICTSTGTVTDPHGNDCCLGNSCNATPNGLTSNYEIPLNSYNFHFTGDSSLVDKVNVGYPCGSQPAGKFNVITNKRTNSGSVPFLLPSIGIYANSTSASDAIAVVGDAGNVGSTGIPIGIRGIASNGVGLNIGVSGVGRQLSTAAGTSYGGEFSSSFIGNDNNTGAAFYAGDATTSNIGIITTAKPSTGMNINPSWKIHYNNANIAILARCEPANTNTNTNVIGQDWAGWFDGDVYINGQGYYTNFGIILSDRKFKKDIKAIENASSIIGRLKPSNYYLNSENEYGIGFSGKKQFGFISQDVEEILPDLVQNVLKPASVDEKGNVIHEATEIKGLNYVGFIALLTKGMQEQQSQIETQQQQIDELKALVQSLTGSPTNNKSGTSTTAVELSDKNAIVLNQNVPNPFAESTVITYNIPDTFERAQILFSTNDGKLIKVVEITEKGAGSLNVFANDLTHGLYSYTLVIDGKTIDTKKMIRE